MKKYFKSKIIIAGFILTIISIVLYLTDNAFLSFYPAGTLVLGIGMLFSGIVMRFLQDK